MTVTKRIVLLLATSGLLFTCIAAGYTARREYQVALDQLVHTVLVGTQNRVDLPLYIHEHDKAGLHRILADFVKLDAVQSAGIYTNMGELLTALDRKARPLSDAPSLHTIRQDAAVTDITLTAYGAEQKLAGTGFWSALTAGFSTIHLVAPVFSPVSPLIKNPSFSDFSSAMNARDSNKSLLVSGYVHVALDRDILLNDVHPQVIRAAFTSLLLFSIIALLILRAMRPTTARLNALMQFAGQILSGDRPAKLNSPDGDEFINITRVLNDAVDSAANNRHEVLLEHKLLKMQAEERASRLSQRELELTQATTEISSAKEQLHRLANYDSLTSLPNRHLFEEQLSVLLRQCARNAKSLAVLFLNFNNFQRINETLGRSVSDLMLQEVGKRLVTCLRGTDMLSHYTNSSESLNVSRLDVDEFAVVLSQLDNVDTAGNVAERLISRLVEPMLLDGHELVAAPRIGIAVAPRDGMDVEELLKAAATAVYHARSKSDGCYLFYQEEMEGSGEADLKLESDLRRAIERNELRLHYQPQVDTSNGSIVCAEALLRWEHAEYGFVSPPRFLALAEKTGLISELGDWALVEACRQMKIYAEEGLNLPRVAINISPQQFKPAFVPRVIEVLESSGLAPSMLELGLSEAILMDQDNDILKALQELKAIGVYLSLENFGTLHAPLGYLSRHPLDEIKIDRSFVSSCDRRKDAARLVQAIIAMAKSLDLRTVAEGVETEGEYRFLVEHGVSVMRGYLFSKPIPAAELRQQLVVPWHFMSQLQRMALLDELRSHS